MSVPRATVAAGAGIPVDLSARAPTSRPRTRGRFWALETEGKDGEEDDEELAEDDEELSGKFKGGQITSFEIFDGLGWAEFFVGLRACGPK